jgi:TolB-like protein/tetratricopeptide (TPR) repeat protein
VPVPVEMPGRNEAAPPRARRLAPLLVLLAVALAALAVTALQGRPTPVAATDLAPPPVAPPTTLVVLPFRSRDAGPRDEVLEAGLAEALSTRLARSGALRLRTLASAQRLVAAGRAPQAVARALGADYVVDGSTRRAGDRVEVQVRLLPAAGGPAVWSDRFDAHSDDVFALPDRIAAALAVPLRVAPGSLAAQAASPCDGGDPVAFRALLRAQFELQRRQPDAVGAFQEAVRRDPTCARAYAGLAMAYIFMAHNDADPAETFALAHAAARQALRIDPRSADAQHAQGRYLQLYAWDWPGAEAALRRAIALNPSLADAHFGLAHVLVNTGRFEEGLEQARQARELDPLSPLINALEAGFLTAAGQPRAAGERVRRALELEPGFWVALLVRGGLALDRGDAAAAVADYRRSAQNSHQASQMLAMVAVAEVAAGNRAAAEAILRDLRQRARARYVPPTSIAAVLNALGQRDAALDELERAYREHDIRVGFLAEDARWNGLRGEPRFQALSRRLGLPNRPATGRY